MFFSKEGKLTKSSRLPLLFFEQNYFRIFSTYRKFKSPFDAVRRLERWYAGLFRYVDYKYLNLSKQSKYLLRNRNFLDVGCGFCPAIKHYERWGFACYGIDISRYALSFVKRAVKAPLICGDIQSGIPFRVSFDLIACLEVLEHLENPDAALQHIYDALRPSGLFFATTPNLNSKLPWFPPFKDPTHINVRSPKQWEASLKSVGFSAYKVEAFVFVPLLWRIVPRLCFIATVPGGPSLLLVGWK